MGRNYRQENVPDGPSSINACYKTVKTPSRTFSQKMFVLGANKLEKRCKITEFLQEPDKLVKSKICKQS
jgi:hypothetical protein